MAYDGNPDPWAVNEEGDLVDGFEDQSGYEDTRSRSRTSSNPPVPAVSSVFSSFMPSANNYSDQKGPGPLRLSTSSGEQKKSTMNDDDLMDFLMDDSNF